MTGGKDVPCTISLEAGFKGEDRAMPDAIDTLTFVHVAISLGAIVAGFVVACGMLRSMSLPRWTALFLTLTFLTSATGFLFPIRGLTPALATGIIALLVLPLPIVGRYRMRLRGRWRATYVITALFSLYLNVFVLVAQAFMKIPALKALAPTQREPPFAITQGIVFAGFVALTIAALKRFHSHRASSADSHSQQPNVT